MEIAIKSFKIISKYDQFLYQQWCLVIQVNHDHVHRSNMNSNQVFMSFFLTLSILILLSHNVTIYNKLIIFKGVSSIWQS